MVNQVYTKITELDPIGHALDGTELFECVQDGDSRKIRANQMVISGLSFITVIDQGSVVPQSRQLAAGSGITLTDNGPGNTLEISVSSGGGNSFGDNWNWATSPTALAFQTPGQVTNWMTVDENGFDVVLQLIANDTLALSVGNLCNITASDTITLSAGGALHINTTGSAALDLNSADTLSIISSTNMSLTSVTGAISLSADTPSITAIQLVAGGDASAIHLEVSGADSELQFAAIGTNSRLILAATGNIDFETNTDLTVGGAGGASPLPATPAGYLLITVGGAPFEIPYYLRA